MAQIACSTWEGGGNVAVFRALAERLRARGHEVTVQVDWDRPPLLDGDVLLIDHMASPDAFKAALESGTPVAVVVHTMWSFVPKLEGTFWPPGYTDNLASAHNLVFTVRELDGDVFPANVVHVGPVIELAGADAGWEPPPRPLVVAGLGTTPMDEAAVLQRILDGLADLPVNVAATVGSHLDPSSVRVPPNARVTGYISHAAMLPHADVFVGHGGLGGIMAALACGVPVVSVPLDRDQPHNAARVEAVGAGRTVAKDADPATIAVVVDAVLTGEREREAARHMSDAIASYGDAAVTNVEALLR